MWFRLCSLPTPADLSTHHWPRIQETRRQTGLTGIFHDVEEEHGHDLSCGGTGRGMPTQRRERHHGELNQNNLLVQKMLRWWCRTLRESKKL